MALQNRITLLSAVALVLALFIGLAIVVQNARSAVQAELDSSAGVAVVLLREVLGDAGAAIDGEAKAAVIRRIGSLEHARHLCVGVYPDDGMPVGGLSGCGETQTAQVPAWFTRLLAVQAVERRERIPLDGSHGLIVVQAHAGDEIAEVWQDTRDLAGLMAVLFIGASILIIVLVQRAMRPVSGLVNGIEALARGEYKLQLPTFSLPELERIARGLRQTAAMLERTERENRTLAHASLLIQEQERRVIARELHDELGQCLVAIKTDAALIAKQGVDTSAAKPAAQRIITISERIYASVRELVQRLRPTTLDELGLAAAVDELVGEWRERHPGMRCACCVDTGTGDLDEASRIHVFRIVQESLTNVAKHAYARQVTVCLRLERRLRLTIADDGVGFSPEHVRRGLGLRGINERVQALGGRLQLHSRPGGGTRLVVTVPGRTPGPPSRRGRSSPGQARPDPGADGAAPEFGRGPTAAC